MDLLQSMRSQLYFCKETEVLKWRKNTAKRPQWNSRYANKPVGCVGNHGYICFNFTHNGKKKQYLAHRVAYALEYGYWPSEIDHIDGNKTNNSLSNLRECTSSQNKQNRSATKVNKLGCKGVCYLGEKLDGTKRFAAYIGENGTTYYIGTYKTIDEARLAYDVEAKIRFGEYASE